MPEENTVVTITQISDSERDSKAVSALANRPNATSRGGVSGLTPEQLKAKFDALPFLLTFKVNQLIAAINGGEDQTLPKLMTTPVVYNGVTLTLWEVLEDIQDGTMANYLMVDSDTLKQAIGKKADKTVFRSNSATGEVSVNAEKDVDLTLTANGISGLAVTIPATAEHGFYFGLNFKSGAQSLQFTTNNLTSYPLHYITPKSTSDTYHPIENCNVQMVYYCDGLSINCIIAEV